MVNHLYHGDNLAVLRDSIGSIFHPARFPQWETLLTFPVAGSKARW